jgi:hypothetical protein
MNTFNVKLFGVFFIVFCSCLRAQQQNVLITDVPNSTALPDASSLLDLSSSSKGLLVPRVNLTSTTSQSPIPNGTSVATALLVYNQAPAQNDVTPGFYYWANSKWNRFDTGNNIGDWKVTGNTSLTSPAAPTTYGTTTIGTSENWIGTTDAVDFVVGTNQIERLRVKQSTGKVGIGTAAPAMRLDVTDASTTTDDATIRGTATGTARTYGVYGATTSTTNAASGVKGEVTGSGYVFGVWGNSSASASIGVRASNTNSTGTGLLVSGNNSLAYTLASTGSGAAFNGIPIGAVSYGNDASGWGICAAGNNNNTSTISGGGGGSFSGNQWGVYSVATLTSPNGTDRSTYVGNYYANSLTPVTVYVGARIGGTHYKILGTTAGSVSTTMPTRSGERILFAPEAPENWFFDLGEIQLKNGKAIVNIDPTFVDCISDSVPFKVFVQGSEDTFGSIRVKRNQKDKTFELEDIGGPSNGIVQYSIYGIWKTKENLRFPEFTPDMHQKIIETPKIK